jgi:hypothetical protein
MSFDMFCMRICTAENSTYSASIMCQHEIDLLGCQWVMVRLSPLVFCPRFFSASSLFSPELYAETLSLFFSLRSSPEITLPTRSPPATPTPPSLLESTPLTMELLPRPSTSDTPTPPSETSSPSVSPLPPRPLTLSPLRPTALPTPRPLTGKLFHPF